MKSTVIAIDLAKNVFEVGISTRPGHIAERRRLSRAELPGFLASQPAAIVVMEACGSAHFWGRKCQGFGHEVKLLPPLAVRPYVQRSKTDRTDVKGMMEAERNSDIHPVPVKTESQQQLTSLHRVRSGWMETRTKRINCIRGLLREFGIIFPVGAAKLTGHVRQVIEDAESPVLMPLREALHQLIEEIAELTKRIEAIEKQLQALAAQTPAAVLLRSIPGVGLLTSTALAGFVGDVQRFPTARHFASYLGLTPKEHSSGMKRRLGHITKHGDVYMRTLLIHGARALLSGAKTKSEPDRLRAWALEVERRRGHNRAVVALANKLARIAWAVWRSGKAFESRTLEATA
jgi:transposase